MHKFMLKLGIRLAVTFFLIGCVQSMVFLYEAPENNSVEQCHAKVPVEQWPDTCDGLENK